MGRIVASVRIDNGLDASKSLKCDAFVDTDALLMVLPAEWKHKLGKLDSTRTIPVAAANQRIMNAEVCGPVCIQIEGFRPIQTEVAFIETESEASGFEPLLGHIVLAQSQAGVDMIGHRLVPIKHMDLKTLSARVLQTTSSPMAAM